MTEYAEAHGEKSIKLVRSPEGGDTKTSFIRRCGLTTLYIISAPVLRVRKVADSLRVITLKRFIFLSFLGIQSVFSNSVVRELAVSWYSKLHL